ncbi:hypothetical protein GMMP15_1110013 [Candidatus Magnetomoraceae bacterium gMMP-15]
MKKKELITDQGSKDTKQISVLKYEPPEITSYTGEEILEQIGPAHACSPSPCLTTGP